MGREEENTQHKIRAPVVKLKGCIFLLFSALLLNQNASHHVFIIPQDRHKNNFSTHTWNPIQIFVKSVRDFS